MAEVMGNKKRLTINLSLFAHNDQTNNNYNNSSTKPPTKSPKSFEPNGVVGLGIVAAMNELDQSHCHFLSPKPSRAAILAVSPRSTPIPIGTVNYSSVSAKFGVTAAKSAAVGGGGPNPEEEMELSEEYTCVISHIGNNMIKKREYFDSTKLFSASPAASLGREVAAAMETAAFQSEGFLSSCYLCKKKLKGLDIFMYRGEKAFCSADCRCKQISIDERKENEKCGSGVMNPMEYSYSVSPCSGPMQFFAGVAAA